MPKKKLSTSALIARIKALRSRHQLLDDRIDRENTRPAPDSQVLRQLKRERLGLRDAIHVTRVMLARARAQDTRRPSTA